MSRRARRTFFFLSSGDSSFRFYYRAPTVLLLLSVDWTTNTKEKKLLNSTQRCVCIRGEQSETRSKGSRNSTSGRNVFAPFEAKHMLNVFYIFFLSTETTVHGY